VGEGNAVWSDGFTIRTLKSLNIWLGGVLLTFPCERRSLLFPDTGTLGLVEDKWRGAVIGVGEPVHTVIVLVANQWVFMVEKSICTVTTSI